MPVSSITLNGVVTTPVIEGPRRWRSEGFTKSPTATRGFEASLSYIKLSLNQFKKEKDGLPERPRLLPVELRFEPMSDLPPKVLFCLLV